MPTTALISAGVGAAGAVGSSLIQSNAAQSASQAQTALGQQALGQQNQLGQQGLQTLLSLFNQAKGIAAPAIATGNSLIPEANTIMAGGTGIINQGGQTVGQGQNIINSVLPTLQALLTPGANMTNTLSQIPGFQFAQDWGQKATQNIGTTTGLGGNVLTAGANYATGLAQQGWQGIVNSLLGVATQGNTLAGTGVGQINAGTGILGVGGNVLNTAGSMITNPTDALVSGAVNTGNSAFGNLNTLASTIGGTTTGIGNAQASGILGSANALAGGLTGATSAGSNALLSNALYGRLFGGGGAPGSGIYGATGPTSYGGPNGPTPLVGS